LVSSALAGCSSRGMQGGRTVQHAMDQAQAPLQPDTHRLNPHSTQHWPCLGRAALIGMRLCKQRAVIDGINSLATDMSLHSRRCIDIAGELVRKTGEHCAVLLTWQWHSLTAPVRLWVPPVPLAMGAVRLQQRMCAAGHTRCSHTLAV
jgi:hypothetical protein